MSAEKMYDIRVVERYIQRGTISKEDYEAYLASLDDGEAESVAIEVRLKNDDLTEEE